MKEKENELKENELYSAYRVVLKVRDTSRLCGGIPVSEELIKKWLATNQAIPCQTIPTRPCR